METIKVIILVLSMSFGFQGFAQSNARQTAFSKSYEFENKANYPAAIKEVEKHYAANDYFTNIRLGWLYYLNKNYSESIKFYNKAIALKPYAIEARFGCVKPLSAIESWAKVKAHYQQILKIDPQNTTANYWLGVIFYNSKDYNSANQLFEKVINFYPLDYDSVIMLAWTKWRLGKNNDAKVLFQHALTMRPTDASALEGLKLIK